MFGEQLRQSAVTIIVPIRDEFVPVTETGDQRICLTYVEEPIGCVYQHIYHIGSANLGLVFRARLPLLLMNSGRHLDSKLVSNALQRR